MNDLEKRIEQLESRINQLEKNNLNMFGRSYVQVGNSNSDYLIKTKGQVKIQYGSKFIDLIKDGKINVDSKFIYQSDSIGIKDGIYVVGDTVTLVINTQQIPLIGKEGNTYVSFQTKQESTSEEKYQALTNIGFIYNSIQDVDDKALKNGIIYIESEQKLYVVHDGLISQFIVDFPNPLTKQLIIQKQDNSSSSILIIGKGIENSIAFDNFYIYSQSEGMVIDSVGDISFKISKYEKIKINNDAIICSANVVSSMFKSNNATDNTGFRLYLNNGQSTLEVDNIIVRNSLANNNQAIMYPYTWNYRSNIIESAQEIENTEDSLQEGFEITLTYENKFEIGQILYTYISFKLEEESFYRTLLLPIRIENFSTRGNSIIVNFVNELINQSELQLLDITTIFQNLQGHQLFLISIEGQTITLLRKSDNNIDLVETEDPDDAIGTDKIILRVGNITELNKSGKENKEEIPIEGFGFYSNNACFLKAQYTNNYNLPYYDNSTKFASTEWINNLFPVGSIIMFSGDTNIIPQNWNICDGTNGTPNLTEKFIKSDEIQNKMEENLLNQDLSYYTLIYIMRLK